jgi:membrane fusion protein (multidrug efflux system)
MAGTGAAFSLLPPENATGNYVKVVQRIPVKIAIDTSSDPGKLLRVGMSVVPTIVTGRTAGDVLKGLNPFK